MFLPLFMLLLMATSPESEAASASAANAVEMIGPFSVTQKRMGSQVELTLALARPVSQPYRYEVVIEGASTVRNAGRVGPGGRVGAALCHLKFSASRQWSGTITIIDSAGTSETLRL